MKILFLNCWFAKAGKNFFDYIKKIGLKADILCLQEVPPELFEKLEKLLFGHRGFFVTEGKVIDFGCVYGQAIFVKNNLTTRSFGKSTFFRQVINDVGFMQYIEVKIKGKTLQLANVHGKARPGHKLDTPVRIRQSRLIIDKFMKKDNPKIIGGDFNLLPETKSILMFEKAGYRNLIKEFGIKDTRGKLNHERFARHDIQYFADYVFVSGGLKVISFKVPGVKVSDHLPLILEFEV